MNILKPALLASILLLSGAAFASVTPRQPTYRRCYLASPEGKGHVGDTASYAAPEGNGHVDVA